MGGRVGPSSYFLSPGGDVELRAIEEAVGWAPVQEIGLTAMCNDAKDHRVLGGMALWLAERLSGVVDLCGEIPELDGQVAKVAYQAANGHTAYISITGTDGLRAWLASAVFRMVK